MQSQLRILHRKDNQEVHEVPPQLQDLSLQLNLLHILRLFDPRLEQHLC